MPKLEQIRDMYNAASLRCDKRIIVCAGTGCIANGSLEVFDELKREILKRDLEVTVSLKSHGPEDNKRMMYI